MRLSAAAGSGICPLTASSDFAGAPTDLRERSREPRKAPKFPSFFFPPTCLMMGDWQPAETALRGCRRKPLSTVRRRRRLALHREYFWRPGKTGIMERPIGVGALWDNSATKRGSNPPRSKRTAPWWGHGNANVRKTGSIPARPLLIPYSLFPIHYLPARRERDPGKLHRKGRKSHGTKQDKYPPNGQRRHSRKG